jgi:hypothetical protein
LENKSLKKTAEEEEIEKVLVEKKKNELMNLYVSGELQNQQLEAKNLLNQ